MCTTETLLWQARREDVGYECRINREHFSIGSNEEPEGSRDENTVITKQISDAPYFQSGE